MTVLDLSEALVAEEIVRIRAEGWSGVVALTQGQVAKGIYFVDGGIAFAASTVEEDRLGACLFRAGRITEGQFRAAMRECEASGRPLGHALVDLGHLAPSELAAAVTAQVERIDAWMVRTRRLLEGRSGEEHLSAEACEKLKAMGYVQQGCS